MVLGKERDAAIEAVAKACRLCESVRAEMGPAASVTKGDQSPVTVADFGAQAVVIRELRTLYPDVPLVAEEDTSDLATPQRADLRRSVVDHVCRVLPEEREEAILSAIASGAHEGGTTGRFWTLDPIDGTKGFLRGGQYAVALALIEDGNVVLGVLGCPSFPVDTGPQAEIGSLFVAVRGQGAFVRGLRNSSERPIHASPVSDPSQAAFCESVEAAHSAHDVSSRVAERLGVTAAPIRMDSQCKYAAVARGDAAIYLRMPTRADYQEKIWDHAAGALVIEEAGGKVTDVRGKPLDFSRGRTLSANSGIVATNGRLHDAVIAAILAG